MKRVFFVDDEPLIAQGLNSITDWGQFGIEVAGSANDGELALEQLLKLGSVDLLITDIMMPNMNGLELIRRVKGIHPRTKFIVLSGYEEFHYVKTGITLGIENYILKPINIEELESTIKHICGDWEREQVNRFRQEEEWAVLRSNVLQRWVNSEIEIQEFKQRAQLLGIPLNYKYYKTVVIRVISEDKPISQLYRMNGLASECEMAAQELLGSNYGVICFPNTNEDIVILYTFMEEEHLSHIGRSIQAMAEQIYSLVGLPVWSSEGDVSHGLAGIQASFKLAQNKFQQCLISGGQSVEYDREGGVEIELSPAPVCDHETFSRILIEGDIEAVQRFIDSLLSGTLHSERFLRQSFVNVAIELMMMAKELEKHPDYSEMLGPLLRINTMIGVRQHVLSVVLRSIERRQERKQEYSPHVSFVMEQIRGHHREELSLKTLSQRLELHPNYLGQLFQQEVGSSFSDYLNQYRIEKATQLLLHTEQKTAEIAALVGYIDTSYFFRQFKKYAGVSPTELRNMYSR